MDTILITTASILAICGATWGARRLSGWPLCPICVGVGGTWAWMLVARERGATVDGAMLAILLGGSVVAVANALEKRLPPGRSALWWKTLFLPTGFVAAYALVAPDWLLFGGAPAALAAVAAFFMLVPAGAATDSRQVDELTEKMRNCC